MKHLKLIALAVGLILVVNATAGAVGIPLKGPMGPVVMHLTNYDDSFMYHWNGGLLADGVTPIVLGTPYAAGLAARTPGIATIAPETAWGVFKVDQILAGEITGPNSISPVGPNIEMFADGDSGIEIGGIFYGGVDMTVTFMESGNLGAQKIRSTEYSFELFTQAVGTYDNGGPVGGPGASNRVDPNEYPSLGYDGTGSNTLLPGAERVLTGVSQPGIEADEFVVTFTPDGFGSGNGMFNTYISLGPLAEAFYHDGTSAGFVGTENWMWDLNTFPCGGAGAAVPGTTADFRLKGTSEPTNKEWLVKSSDPMTGAVVPEPLTMTLLFVGIGGLGSYIRKRRQA